MGCQLRTPVDLLKPSISARVHIKQDKQKNQYDHHAKCRDFTLGVLVFFRNFGRGPKWVSGVINSKQGQQMLEVRLEVGGQVRQHIDQVLLVLFPRDQRAGRH